MALHRSRNTCRSLWFSLLVADRPYLEPLGLLTWVSRLLVVAWLALDRFATKGTVRQFSFLLVFTWFTGHD